MINKNQEKEKPALIELKLEYFLIYKDGQEEKKESLAKINEENIILQPDLGDPIQLSFRDIIKISEVEYQICFDLVSGDKIFLYNLGYQYEDFLRLVLKFRNKMLLSDLLMNEAIKKSGIQAEVYYSDKNEKELFNGSTEVTIYETAIVVIPDRYDFIRIPYGSFSEINIEDYKVIILTESGDKIIFSKMGDQLDSFVKIISERINELSLETQSFFKGILPNADALLIRKISQVMKEGKAVNINTIKSISKELYSAFENRMEGLGIKEEYNYFKEIADEEKISFGFKKGLMGDLTGDYFWFLIPIYSADTNKGGNVIAMEATDASGNGKSTYFFRIFERKVYKTIKDIEKFRNETDAIIEIINKAMIEINFRREPIYLSDEKLNEPEYSKYKIAIEKLPALNTLRNLFIGRIIHSSFEQWENDVNDLLKFNVLEIDDNKKWEKSEIMGEANH